MLHQQRLFLIAGAVLRTGGQQAPGSPTPLRDSPSLDQRLERQQVEGAHLDHKVGPGSAEARVVGPASLSQNGCSKLQNFASALVKSEFDGTEARKLSCTAWVDDAWNVGGQYEGRFTILPSQAPATGANSLVLEPLPFAASYFISFLFLPWLWIPL